MRDKIGKAAKLKSMIDNDRKNIDLLELAIVATSDDVEVAQETTEKAPKEAEKQDANVVTDPSSSEKVYSAKEEKVEEKKVT